MLREISLLGALAPSALIYFLLTVPVFLAVDRLIARLGVYGLLWNPPLVRVGLFICMFWASSLVPFPDISR